MPMPPGVICSDNDEQRLTTKAKSDSGWNVAEFAAGDFESAASRGFSRVAPTAMSQLNHKVCGFLNCTLSSIHSEYALLLQYPASCMGWS